ncbi:MAG: hypothetical protein K6G30_02205 [Acetatifactor sp.]|nr:hypothetical protein [Acetatifactor sp.]
MDERDNLQKKCDKEGCENCICITCMHQGFDCECAEEKTGPITLCDDYDQMGGEQLTLEL